MSINLNKVTELKKLSDENKIQLVAVTKNRNTQDIENLINQNILNFGENRVQEAQKKFIILKNKFDNLFLHLI